MADKRDEVDLDSTIDRLESLLERHSGAYGDAASPSSSPAMPRPPVLTDKVTFEERSASTPQGSPAAADREQGVTGDIDVRANMEQLNQLVGANVERVFDTLKIDLVDEIKRELLTTMTSKNTDGDTPPLDDVGTADVKLEPVAMVKTFDPHVIERDRYTHWEQSGYFQSYGSGAPYCIMLPPPNVTGSLHMGHAFQDTLMDALIRYKRMQGQRALWQCGTDHAGIATQMVVERRLAAQGLDRKTIGREKFVAAVWDWKEESGGATHGAIAASRLVDGLESRALYLRARLVAGGHRSFRALV